MRIRMKFRVLGFQSVPQPAILITGHVLTYLLTLKKKKNSRRTLSHIFFFFLLTLGTAVRFFPPLPKFPSHPDGRAS